MNKKIFTVVAVMAVCLAVFAGGIYTGIFNGTVNGVFYGVANLTNSIISGQLIGDGEYLTNLQATYIAPGTAHISITGASGSATNVVSGIIITNASFKNGNSAGLNNTFNANILNSIAIAPSGVTNTSTAYGVAMINATSWTVYNSMNVALFTNTLDGGFVIAMPLAPGSYIKANGSATGSLIFP